VLLEGQIGLTVVVQILDSAAFNRKTFLSRLDQPPEQQPWDIALRSVPDRGNFPVFWRYTVNAFDGEFDWVFEEPELRRLYEQVLEGV
jgi:hypothetical protein